jgi:predicted transcriptional regulator
MTYQLMNFNITNDLKAVLDELSKRKHVSRTSILNHLIATHCTKELSRLRRLSEELSQ